MNCDNIYLKYKNSKELFSNSEMIKLLNLNHEVCGHSKSTKCFIYFFGKSQGQIINNRDACIVNFDYSNFIHKKLSLWHTHPKNSKFYPSVEDFLKSYFYKKSFIFTPFGMWIIQTDKKLDHYINYLDELNNYYFYFPFYFNETLNQFTKKVKKNLKIYINKIKELGIIIKFIRNYKMIEFDDTFCIIKKKLPVKIKNVFFERKII